MSMSGKICVVTGATAGIGKAAAITLAAQEAELILVGRSQEKAEAVRQEISALTGSDKVSCLWADFSDLGQVRSLAQAIIQRHPRLDLLVNNAGAFFNRRHETGLGVEKSFLVNHLAPFLLTNLLLDLLVRSAPARIVNLSSDAHQYGSMDFDDLGFQRGYRGIKGYARSKLANLMFTYELARRLEGSGVTVNAVHPGHVATDIWRASFPVIGPALKWVMGLFALTPEEGADTVIHLAASPELEGISGKYFASRQPIPSSPPSYDQDAAARLWQLSARMVGLD